MVRHAGPLRGESQEVMKTHHWLFRKLNLSLRLEVIVNISVLMMVAILLIGFTIAKTNENAIIQERIRSSEDMVKTFRRSSILWPGEPGIFPGGRGRPEGDSGVHRYLRERERVLRRHGF